MPATADTTIIAHALALGRVTARAAKGTKSAREVGLLIRELATDEGDFVRALEALKRVEASLPEGAADLEGAILRTLDVMVRHGLLKGLDVTRRYASEHAPAETHVSIAGPMSMTEFMAVLTAELWRPGALTGPPVDVGAMFSGKAP